MTQPTMKQFGYSKKTGWPSSTQQIEYETARIKWINRPRKIGRERQTDIHPSWIPYLTHFDTSDPTRSQNAFARWLGVNPATVSGAKRKQISPNMAYDIERWSQSVGHE